MKHRFEDSILPPTRRRGIGHLLILAAVIAVIGLMLILGLTGCAAKTPPEFLQNAAASMFGGMRSLSGGSLESAGAPVPAPQHNGFDSFFNPGGGQ